jgi:glucose 1-dehydrogenase
MTELEGKVAIVIASPVRAYGGLDIMVNNAGVETRTSILDTTEAQYDLVMNVPVR